MSRKQKKLSKNTNDNKDKNEEVVKSEPKTKKEKIATGIILGIAAVLIIVIILVNIPYNGDKGRAAEKFDSLTIDNVFDIIKFDELQEMINNGEEFQVLLINKRQDKANYFIYCVDDLAKEYIEESNGKTETIYLLDSSLLKESEYKFFKDIDKKNLDVPTLIEFKKTDETVTNSFESNWSSRYAVEEYGSNYWRLLLKYFEDCYAVTE